MSGSSEYYWPSSIKDYKCPTRLDMIRRPISVYVLQVFSHPPGCCSQLVPRSSFCSGSDPIKTQNTHYVFRYQQKTCNLIPSDRRTVWVLLWFSRKNVVCLAELNSKKKTGILLKLFLQAPEYHFTSLNFRPAFHSDVRNDTITLFSTHPLFVITFLLPITTCCTLRKL